MRFKLPLTMEGQSSNLPAKQNGTPSQERDSLVPTTYSHVQDTSKLLHRSRTWLILKKKLLQKSPILKYKLKKHTYIENYKMLIKEMISDLNSDVIFMGYKI